MFQLQKKSLELPDSNSALPHRADAIQPAPEHFVSGNRFVEPVPANLQKAVFGLGCVWGAEQLVGYCGLVGTELPVMTGAQQPGAPRAGR